MIERLKKFWMNLFSSKKFLDKDRKSIGDKKIGDVYEMNYMPSPDNPGEMVIVFAKKEDEIEDE